MEIFSIEKTLLINAPTNEVFDALTNSNKIVQYYPLEEVISDWQVDSEIICKGNVDGNSFSDYGKIDVLLPNEKFQYTYWSTNHGTERTSQNYVTICYSLSEQDNGTTLTLEQKNIQSEPIYLQMLQVWDFLLSNLKNFVEKNRSSTV
ncbi:SRPBCC domain-containing protein [Pleurocapsa sp. PCC 7319]|uniref:SRPBCC family protein n=1 Tax=Pleurocapsa sp. PCC 7319 TaxID=118161 RepID=UPI00034775C8|nr:SRPBCC domain-containing protein [Pleurocapsa sp. PCC 7319]